MAYFSFPLTLSVAHNRSSHKIRVIYNTPEDWGSLPLINSSNKEGENGETIFAFYFHDVYNLSGLY